MVGDSQRLRGDRQTGVDRCRRREERGVDDEEILDVMRAAVRIQHRVTRVAAEAERAALVRGVLAAEGVLDDRSEAKLAEGPLRLADEAAVRPDVVGAGVAPHLARRLASGA